MAAPPTLDTRLVREWALELGIEELGVCQAEHYAGAEAIIRDRRERGLFADMHFTMARPEVSCHPERLVDGAVSVISAALCYWAPDAPPPDVDRPTGRLARYTRGDAYTALAERLEQIAQRLLDAGFQARVLVDSNHHVDREAAIRSGVGFSGKHTVVITRRHGSWVVLGTLVTDAPLEPTLPMRPGCGTCTACIDACPTDALVDQAGGELDATRCITYWTQSRRSIPLDVREAMGDRAYGCDICQDACPWNRGVQARRAGAPAEPWAVDLVGWLERSDQELDEEWQRLYVPRRRMKFLRRNAIVVIGNSGRQQDAALVAPFLDHEDEHLREHAIWALRQLGGPLAQAALAAHGL